MQPSFFERVWLVVSQVPRGKVASYGQIAATSGPSPGRAYGRLGAQRVERGAGRRGAVAACHQQRRPHQHLARGPERRDSARQA